TRRRARGAPGRAGEAGPPVRAGRAQPPDLRRVAGVRIDGHECQRRGVPSRPGVTRDSSPHETPHRPGRPSVPQPIDDPAPPQLPPDSGYQPPHLVPPPRRRTPRKDVVGLVVVLILSLFVKVGVNALTHQDPDPPVLTHWRAFWHVPLDLLQRIGRP